MRHAFPLLLALAVGCGGPRASTGRRPGSDDTPLTPEAVAEEVALVRRALDEAYAGRVFHTDDSWRSLHRDLDAVEAAPQTVDSLCEGLGEAVSRLTKPALYATRASGPRCGVRTAGAHTYEADDLGVNAATGTERAYTVVETDDGEATGRLAILAIRSFADEARWEGFVEAVDRVAAAAAVIVDLRGAVGEDPRPALPLLRRLSGLPEVAPLHAIEVRQGPMADRIRANRVPGSRVRDPAAYRPFVGIEPPCRTPARPRHVQDTYVRGLDEPPLVVLLGGRCGGACELVARSLQTYAGARLVGGVGWYGRLGLHDVGILELPRSGLRLSIPTAAYVLNLRVRRSGGLRGGWQNQRGRDLRFDGLGRSLEGLRATLRQRARIRPWVDRDPPPCASFPAYPNRQAMPSPHRERVNGDWHEEPNRRIEGFILLPPDRARRYLAACPGVTYAHAYPIEPTGRMALFDLTATGFEPLSRLAQSPVLEFIQIGFEEEHVPMVPE